MAGKRRGIGLLIGVLIFSGCATQRSTSVPAPDAPLLGQFEEPAAEPESGGPTDADVQELARLFQDAKTALTTGRQDAAERCFEEALDRISDIELRFGDLSQDYDDYNRLVDQILEQYRSYMQAVVPYERVPYRPQGPQPEMLEAPDTAVVEAPAPGALPPVPYTMNRDVETFLSYFQGRGRKWMRIYLARASRWQPVITKVLREEGMPDNLFYLAMIESGLSTTARSHARAVGMWQFISSTARVYNLRIDAYVDERMDPVKSTRAASHFLKNLYREYGDWYLAFSGYNGNKKHVTRSIVRYKTRDFWKLKNGLPRETRSYVPKYIAAALIAENPEKYGFHDLDVETPLPYEEVTLSECVDLEMLARCAGADYETMRQLNAELVRAYTPPGGKPYVLKVPVGAGQRFTAELQSLPSDYKVEKVIHVVQRGQTVSEIARRYGLSINDVMASNNLRNPNRLSVGQTLTIPAPFRPGVKGQAAVRTPVRVRTETAQAAPPDNAREQIYTVRRGDTLEKIARRFSVTITQIRDWNGIRNGAYIYPNQKLSVYAAAGEPAHDATPAPALAAGIGGKRSHLVRRGDTMWDIAQRYSVSLASLMRENNKDHRSKIHPGERLSIPAE